MGYLIEIDSLSCHITYAKAELPPAPPAEVNSPASNVPDVGPSFEQTELKLDSSPIAATTDAKET
jgi:hypothetical protein